MEGLIIIIETLSLLNTRSESKNVNELHNSKLINLTRLYRQADCIEKDENPFNLHK